MQLTGGPDQPPTKSGLSLVDFCGGYVAAIATLAGVWQAARDGRGCDADLSLFETALAQLTYIGTWVASKDFEPRRMPDSAHQTMVPFQAFPTADGWIMIACPKQKLWELFCDAIGAPELTSDPRFADFAGRDRNRDVLVPKLEEILRRRPTAEWLAQMAAARRAERARQRRAGRVRRPPGGRARGRRRVRAPHPRQSSAARPRRFAWRARRLRRHAGRCSASTRASSWQRCAATGRSGSAGLQQPGSSGQPTTRRTDDRAVARQVPGGLRGRRRLPQPLGRTITETDNIWFTCLTMNTNQMHFNREYAARTEFGEPLVVSTLTLAVVHRALRRGHVRERGRQPRLGRHQASAAGVRG